MLLARPKSSSDEQKEQRERDEALKEELSVLQDKVKRQPDLWKWDVEKHMGVFREKLLAYKENPAKRNMELAYYMLFLAHISHTVYKQLILESLSSTVLSLLQQYYSILHPDNRMAMVTVLKILRGKELLAATMVVPVMLKLMKCKDKELRKYIHGCVIGDLKKSNKGTKQHAVNRKLQNFIFEMLKDPNETAAKRALSVMIELFKRRIWNDDKTVNVISSAGCLHSNPKVVAAACKFFLVMEYDYESESEDEGDSSDEEQEKKMILGKYKGTKKMTKNRMSRVDRVIKQAKRKEKRKNKVKYSTDFLPIDLIHDPQDFVEKLFAKLRKSTDCYEVKLLMMRLISRLIGRHQLLLLQFYPYLMRYLESHEKDKVGEVFAMVIEACHELIPPEEVKPLIEKIIANFITEYCGNQHITIGLNTIREILLRMPLALDQA